MSDHLAVRMCGAIPRWQATDAMMALLIRDSARLADSSDASIPDDFFLGKEMKEKLYANMIE